MRRNSRNIPSPDAAIVSQRQFEIVNPRRTRAARIFWYTRSGKGESALEAEHEARRLSGRLSQKDRHRTRFRNSRRPGPQAVLRLGAQARPQNLYALARA